MAASLDFSQIILHTFDKANPLEINLPPGKAWKIESIGIAGTNGTVYLQNDDPTPKNLAILFTTIDEDDFGASMPFWLPHNFSGWLHNDSGYMCAVSITDYDYDPGV